MPRCVSSCCTQKATPLFRYLLHKKPKDKGERVESISSGCLGRFAGSWALSLRVRWWENHVRLSLSPLFICTLAIKGLGYCREVVQQL